MNNKVTSPGILFFCLIFSVSSYAQQMVSGESSPASYNRDFGTISESLWTIGQQEWKSNLMQELGLDEAGFSQFIEQNIDAYQKDRGEFFMHVRENLNNVRFVPDFFSNLERKYAELYKMEGYSFMRSPVPLPAPQSSCNPSCYNINFSSGTLAGWNAYYAVDASTCSIIVNSKTGGACGSVTQAGGPDPNTGSTYQVQLMTTPGSDPIAGGMIPYTPPLGGLCARIGDGARNGFGIGILEQTYMVDASSPILTVQFAVALENPNHPCNEQPWFKMEVLDQNGNPIPGCGQYFVVSAGGLPGFKGVYYPTDGDTVYCRPWSTAFVPLYNYIGQCVTVRYTASDCSQGGHFGYAYVASTCSKINLVASSNVWCTGQQSATITGPPGAALYQWTTSGGCISGSATNQVVKITCAGTYNLVTQSTAGVTCVDTFSISIPSVPVGPPPTPCFSATRVCSGNPTLFNASCSTPSTGNKFYWDFYNNGQYNDSSGATPSWTFNAGGNYPVRLHLVSANGCSTDTVITVPVDTTNILTSPPVITTTITNATSCSACDGQVAYAVANGATLGLGDTIYTSFDNSVLVYLGIMVIAHVSGPDYCGSVVGGPADTLKFCHLCPGTHYIYYKPKTATGSTLCNPAGFTGLTTPVIITGGNVNITSNITINNSSCGASNGSATVTGIGGSGSYTYSWSNGLGSSSTVTGLAAGSYTVTIKDDSSCVGTSKVVILGFTGLSTHAIPFDVSCYGANNGSVKVSVTSGTGPYTYSWSPNVSSTDSAGNLAPGTYSVYVTDAGGCTGIATAKVSQPTKVNAGIVSSVTSVPCGFKGSAVANGSGGYGPYTYSWSPSAELTASATALGAGLNVVTITDALGCTDTANVTVKVNCVIKAVFTSSDTSFCNEGGECINFFDNSVGNPTSWKWTFNGATPDTSTLQNPTNICYYAPGSYSVQLIVSGAAGTDTLTVNPLIIFYTSAAKPTITVSNDTLFCSHAAAYQWYLNGSPISGATDSIYVVNQAGGYSVYITDDNGCSRLADIIYTGIHDLSGSEGLIVYPNPATQSVVISLPSAVNGRAEVTITNVLGEMVLQSEIINPKSELNISSLAKGVYLVQVITDKKSYRVKMIKE